MQDDTRAKELRVEYEVKRARGEEKGGKGRMEDVSREQT